MGIITNSYSNMMVVPDRFLVILPDPTDTSAKKQGNNFVYSKPFIISVARKFSAESFNVIDGSSPAPVNLFAYFPCIDDLDGPINEDAYPPDAMMAELNKCLHFKRMGSGFGYTATHTATQGEVLFGTDKQNAWDACHNAAFVKGQAVQLENTTQIDNTQLFIEFTPTLLAAWGANGTINIDLLAYIASMVRIVQPLPMWSKGLPNCANYSIAGNQEAEMMKTDALEFGCGFYTGVVGCDPAIAYSYAGITPSTIKTASGNNGSAGDMHYEIKKVIRTRLAHLLDNKDFAESIIMQGMLKTAQNKLDDDDDDTMFRNIAGGKVERIGCNVQIDINVIPDLYGTVIVAPRFSDLVYQISENDHEGKDDVDAFEADLPSIPSNMIIDAAGYLAYAYWQDEDANYFGTTFYSTINTSKCVALISYKINFIGNTAGYQDAYGTKLRDVCHTMTFFPRTVTSQAILDEAYAAASANATSVTNALASVGDLITQVDELNEEVETLTTSKTTLTNQLAGLADDIADANQELADVQDTLAATQSELATAQESYTTVTQAITTKTNQLTDLTAQVGTATTNLAALNTQITSAQSQVIALQDSITTKTAQAESLEASVHELSLSISTLQTEKEGLEISLAAAQEAYDDAVAEKEEAELALEVAQRELQAFTESDAYKAIADAQAALDSMAAQLQTATANYNQKVAQTVELEAGLVSLNSQLAAVQSQILAKQGEQTAVQSELDTLNSQKNSLTVSINTLNETLETLTERVAHAQEITTQLENTKAELAQKQAEIASAELARTKINADNYDLAKECTAKRFCPWASATILCGHVDTIDYGD